MNVWRYLSLDSDGRNKLYKRRTRNWCRWLPRTTGSVVQQTREEDGRYDGFDFLLDCESGSRRERGSRDLVPDRLTRAARVHASIDEDYWRTDVDVPIVFSIQPALFKVISRVEEPRTTCFDNTYLPVLLEAFFNGFLMIDQLVDPVSLLMLCCDKGIT